ncbi:MAG: oxidoreductase [Candidatus Hydrogenedentota bacterium]
MSKPQVNWGLIGSTGWADSTFGPAIAAADNGCLHAVLSSKQANADAYCEKHEVEKGYADLDAFLADDTIDAIWVASANHLHAPQTIAALKAGKHVLCEKPMALNVAECEAMISAAEEADRQLGIGYHLRHHPLHQELRQEWKAGRFGSPVFFRAQLYFAHDEPPSDWRRKRATSGGWALSDIGTHLIDLCRWFMGDVEAAQGILSSPRWGFETDDHALVTMRFKGGAVGVAEASTGAGGPARIEMYGTDAYCICERTYFGHGGLVTRGQGNGEPKVSGAHNVNPYRNQVEAFGRAVLNGEPFPVPAREGLENLRVMQTARGY